MILIAHKFLHFYNHVNYDLICVKIILKMKKLLLFKDYRNFWRLSKTKYISFNINKYKILIIENSDIICKLSFKFITY